MIAALLTIALAATATAPLAADEGAPPKKGSAVVDINHAGLTELCTLPGIGPKKAEAILQLRQKKPFTRVTQLLQVKGIGPKTLDKLKPFVSLGPPPRVPEAPTPTTTPTKQQPLPELAPLASASPSPPPSSPSL